MHHNTIPAKTGSISELDALVSRLLHPVGVTFKQNQVIGTGSFIGRRDPLTELQQKILVEMIASIHTHGNPDYRRTEYSMKFSEFQKICAMGNGDAYTFLTGEMEKILKKGVWLHCRKNQKLIRASWFQSIEFSGGEIFFQFSEKIMTLIAGITPGDAEHRLVKGLQYQGKHTMALFELIWSWKSQGLIEIPIPLLMKQLSLEHTRYSYGQLKLRVLEPSFEEIYACDDAIFIRFGPTFSGRKVEGVWMEVTVGAEACKMRQNEPEFRVAPPDQKSL
jgi:plasmid replication initiation protein